MTVVNSTNPSAEQHLDSSPAHGETVPWHGHVDTGKLPHHVLMLSGKTKALEVCIVKEWYNSPNNVWTYSTHNK